MLTLNGEYKEYLKLTDTKEILTSTAMSLDISLGENIFVFDFDDTLMFAEHWAYSTRTLDGAIESTDSRSLTKALNFLEPDYSLKEESVNIRGKDESVFRVINNDGTPALEDDLLSTWSKNQLRKNYIDLSKKYVDYPAVTDDKAFYSDPRTIALGRVNSRIFKIYNECNGKRIILTARSAVNGMGESILKKIKDSGGKTPDHIFTMPLKSLAGGEYKGAVILGLAKSVGPNGSVVFYDDNPQYISGVKKIIESASEDIGSVIIHKVDPSKDEQELSVEVENNSLEDIREALESRGLEKYAKVIQSIIDDDDSDIKKKSMLKRKMRKSRGKNKRDRVEWALMSRKSPRRVLKWFGPDKPSKRDVAKEEARIHYFSR